MGTIVGSAVCNLTWAVSVICIASTFHFNQSSSKASKATKTVLQPPSLHLLPIIRDMSFYFLSVGLLYYFRTTSHRVIWWKSLILVCMYIIYIAALFLTSKYVSPSEKMVHEEETEEIDRLMESSPPLKSSISHDQPKSSLSLYRTLTYPIDRLFYYTIPSLSPVSTSKNVLTFAMSLLYVALLSLAVLWSVGRIGCVMGINETFLGLTVVAVGASLPDTITMAAAALRGHGAMAISGLIGSNIFDVLIGLGLPWLLFDLIGHNVYLHSRNVVVGIVALIASCIVLIFSFVIHRTKLIPSAAILPFVAYIGYIIAEVQISY